MKPLQFFKKRNFILFISFYIVVQFLWWEVQLHRNQTEIIDLKMKLEALQGHSSYEIKTIHSDLQREFRNKIAMIVGEGTVFLILLVLGFYYIVRLENRDLQNLREKEHFFIGITHELKTPLTSLRLQLQTLQRTGTGEWKENEYIRQALADVHRIDFLINNLLQSRRLMFGKIEPEIHMLSVKEVLEKVTRWFSSEELLRMKLSLQENVSNLLFKGDRTMCESILANLLQNALKYSPSDKKILLEAKLQNNNELLFTLKNYGDPPDENFKRNLFSPYFRMKSNSGGTGLGLFVARSFAQCMKQKLEYHYEQPFHVFIWHIKIQSSKN